MRGIGRPSPSCRAASRIQGVTGTLVVVSSDPARRAASYYDRFAPVYDVVSSARYYRRPREAAIAALRLAPGDQVLNVPCGTGQNLALMQVPLGGAGRIVGVDVSPKMLARAAAKVSRHGWSNVDLVCADVTTIDGGWAAERGVPGGFDAVLCDLGLSGFPDWRDTVDRLLSAVRPGGRFVVMDWHIPQRTRRGDFIRWVGKGDVDRDLSGYLRDVMGDVSVDRSFKGGDMFVAVGIKAD